MRLPDPSCSQAILIGVSSYQSSELPDVPAVRNNLDGLANALTAPGLGGFAPEHCTVLTDPSSVRLTYRAIRDHADRAGDTLLVYFAGHGLLGSRRGELFLGLADTEPSELLVSALNFGLIREVFLDCPATNKVLILDCCFSGRAAQDFLAPTTDAVLGEVEIAGTYTIASAPPNSVALAPPDATYTAFTGELISLLNTGISDGPELLTLGTIYRHLRRTMTAKGLPLPGQRGTDTTELLALTSNPAYQHPRAVEVIPPEVAATEPEARSRRDIHRRLAVVSAAAVVAAAVVVTIVLRDSQSHDPAGGPPASRTTQSTSTSQVGTTTSTTTTTIPALAPASDPRQVALRVFNASTVAKFAGQAAQDFRNDGWSVVEVANYSETIIPTATVYYRPGTEEDAAARALAAKFNLKVEQRLSNFRYQPGLVVMITNDYGSR